MTNTLANPYFGEAWNPNIAKFHPQAPTPLGQACSSCGEEIASGDSGFVLSSNGPIHLECFLRHLYGSVGHQGKRCSCYGGSEEDPHGMTKRQAAIAAVEHYQSQPSNLR